MKLLGTLDERALGEQMAAAAVFASPALYEPFGLAALEAARAGSALVLSDTPGFRELWEDAALFVPARDHAALAEALASLLAEPGRRRQLAEAAARRATGYARSAMVARTLDVYRSALAHAEATAAA